MLNHAFVTADPAAFEKALEHLGEGRTVVPSMTEIIRLTDTLNGALARFRDDSRLAALAHHEIPDARLRLDHVVTMTEDAANKTLDLMERAAPLAAASLRGAEQLLATLDKATKADVRSYLEEVRGNFEEVRSNLSEVILAQSFQDLTGQILRGVQRLIGEVETALAELARVTGVQVENKAPSGTDLEGPAVPGITRNAVTEQADVDDLIAGLGL
jgi:chemotaxis protein CheZ